MVLAILLVIELFLVIMSKKLTVAELVSELLLVIELLVVVSSRELTTIEMVLELLRLQASKVQRYRMSGIEPA